jgi:hypothetical protein
LNLGRNGSTCESTSPTNACLLDNELASGLKNGYLFDLLGDSKMPDQSYTVTATPTSSNDGDCQFAMNQTGVIESSAVTIPLGRQTAGNPSGGSSCGD